MVGIDRQAAFSGTKDVSSHLSVDVAALADYLAAHLKNFAGPLSVKQFKGGQSNPTYFLQTPSHAYVLRRRPPGKLLPSAHAIDREYRVISALRAQRFPVAEPILYCNDETILGSAFYVMSFVKGRVFWEPSLPDSNPAERHAIYASMNGTLAKLHNFDPAKIGLSDFGKSENYVARQVERWSRQYRASQTQAIAEMDRLMDWLPHHLPPPAPFRLVHGDYRLDNLIVAANGPNVAAVLDWELSTLGDPLADFTYHLMQWHMPDAYGAPGTASLVGHDLKTLGIPSLPDYIEMYVAHGGLDPRPHLPIYLAYNFFRMAAIVQGIVGRVRDGSAANENAPVRAEMVLPLAVKAWDFAQQAGA